MSKKNSVLSWIKGEAVLCIAAVCALVSMLFVPPSAAYLAYIDVRVLCLLFCSRLISSAHEISYLNNYIYYNRHPFLVGHNVQDKYNIYQQTLLLTRQGLLQ